MSVIVKEGALVITGWHVHDHRWITLAVPPGQLDILRQYVLTTFRLEEGIYSRMVCASLLYYQLFGVKLTKLAGPATNNTQGLPEALPTDIVNALKEYMSPEVYAAMTLTTKTARKVELNWVRVCPRLVLERCYSMKGPDAVALASTALMHLSEQQMLFPDLMREATHPITMLVVGYIIGADMIENIAVLLGSDSDIELTYNWKDSLISYGRLDVLTMMPEMPFPVVLEDFVPGDSSSAKRMWMTPSEYISAAVKLGIESYDGNISLYVLLTSLKDDTNSTPWKWSPFCLKLELMVDLIMTGVISRFNADASDAIEGDDVDKLRDLIMDLSPQQREALRSALITEPDDDVLSVRSWIHQILNDPDQDEMPVDDAWIEFFNNGDQLYQLGNNVVCMYNIDEDVGELFIHHGGDRYRPLDLSHGHEKLWDINWDTALSIPAVRGELASQVRALLFSGWHYLVDKPDEYISAKLAIVSSLMN